MADTFDPTSYYTMVLQNLMEQYNNAGAYLEEDYHNLADTEMRSNPYGGTQLQKALASGYIDLERQAQNAQNSYLNQMMGQFGGLIDDAQAQQQYEAQLAYQQEQLALAQQQAQLEAQQAQQQMALQQQQMAMNQEAQQWENWYNYQNYLYNKKQAQQAQRPQVGYAMPSAPYNNPFKSNTGGTGAGGSQKVNSNSDWINMLSGIFANTGSTVNNGGSGSSPGGVNAWYYSNQGNGGGNYNNQATQTAGNIGSMWQQPGNNFVDYTGTGQVPGITGNISMF